MSSNIPPRPPAHSRGPISVMDGMDQQALAIVYAAALTATRTEIGGSFPDRALAAGRIAVQDFRALMVSQVDR